MRRKINVRKHRDNGLHRCWIRQVLLYSEREERGTRRDVGFSRQFIWVLNKLICIIKSHVLVEINFSLFTCHSKLILSMNSIFMIIRKNSSTLSDFFLKNRVWNMYVYFQGIKSGIWSFYFPYIKTCTFYTSKNARNSLLCTHV